MGHGEEELDGGNAAGRVVRIGDTVRKPFLDSTPATIDFVTALRRAGVDVPLPAGRDAEGRQIWEYVPGRLIQDDLPLDETALRRVGRMIRQIHDASPSSDSLSGHDNVLIPATGADLICHNDLAPWNLIVGDDDRWVFIDWDGAGPSTRLWDLAYAAQSFALLNADQDAALAGARLRWFVDGYGAEAATRQALPEVMTQRTAAMHALLEDAHASGREPWGSMYLNGHGEYWRSTSEYIGAHQSDWHEALRHPTSSGAGERNPGESESGEMGSEALTVRMREMLEADAAPTNASVARLIAGISADDLARALRALMPEARERHRRLGLSDAMSEATLADIERKHQLYGADTVAAWLLGILRGDVVQVGRLQVERKSGAHGHGLHIPETGSLTPDSVTESLDRAHAFTGASRFSCGSWLLDRELTAAFPASNIAAFARRFDIVQEDEEEDGDRAVAKFVFRQKPSDVVSGAVAPRTRLEHYVVERLRSGARWTQPVGVLDHTGG